jgi:hypothetical protein
MMRKKISTFKKSKNESANRQNNTEKLEKQSWETQNIRGARHNQNCPPAKSPGLPQQ